MGTPTIEEIQERIKHGYHMSPRGQIFEDVLVLSSEVDRLKAENKRLQGKLTAWERSADATSGRSR